MDNKIQEFNIIIIILLDHCCIIFFLDNVHL